MISINLFNLFAKISLDDKEFQKGVDTDKLSKAEFVKAINLLTKNEAELQGELQRLLKIIDGYDNYKKQKHGLSTEIVIENGRSATFVHLGDNYYKLIYCS